MGKFNGISFIIAHRERDDITKTIASIHTNLKKIKIKIDYEIISVAGNHPTVQRNHAVEEAIYSHLYFLDDDSRINEKSIQILIDLLKNMENDSKVSLIGGPALLLQPATFFEECVNGVLSSYGVVGKIRSRYKSIGQPRLSNDQEMILCNLIIDKEKFIKLKKFDTNLYPNEENDFISRLLFAEKEKKNFGGVLYHPQIYIERPQRKTFRSYIKQMLTYGRGRAEQTKNNIKTVHPHLLLSIPVFMIFCLCAFIFLFSFFGDVHFKNQLVEKFLKNLKHLKLFVQYSLGLYALYTIIIMIRKSLQRGKLLLYIPLLIFLCQFFYGLGILLGFFQKGFSSKNKIVTYKINKRPDPEVSSE